MHVANGQLYIADRGNNRIRRVDLGTNVIATVAGNGAGAFAGDGGAATSASLNLPTDMVVGNGALYIADRQNARVRRVDLSTGIITTIAGNGGLGASGIGPSGLALAGNRLYISDDGTARVQELDLWTGAMTTVAGTITTGFIGDGGQGTAAKLDQPAGLLLSSNALFIADTFNQRIRRLQLKAEQAPLIVTAPATAVFGTTATIDVTGGSSTGAITLAASGACTVAGADSVTMTSGVGTCSVVATKAGDAAYFSTTSVPVLIAAVNATPTVSWPTPADVTYGTALSTTQLSATASVSGTFQVHASCRRLPQRGHQPDPVGPVHADGYQPLQPGISLGVDHRQPGDAPGDGDVKGTPGGNGESAADLHGDWIRAQRDDGGPDRRAGALDDGDAGEPGGRVPDHDYAGDAHSGELCLFLRQRHDDRDRAAAIPLRSRRDPHGRHDRHVRRQRARRRSCGKFRR